MVRHGLADCATLACHPLNSPFVCLSMIPAQSHPLATDRRAELDFLTELEQRQDDLLRRLEELDRRVERVLAEWMSGRVEQPC
jgi:hypothetical protein